jgi:hypothetical protein
MFRNRLKRDYVKHHNSISETGQGLIDEGRKSEFAPDSKLANIWGTYLIFVVAHDTDKYLEQINKVFPWYKRLHALMDTSPIVDTSAIANSTTDIDLTVLQSANGALTKAKATKSKNYVRDIIFTVNNY